MVVDTFFLGAHRHAYYALPHLTAERFGVVG